MDRLLRLDQETMDETRWHCRGAGHYECGLWTARSWRRREWWLFKGGVLWGGWREEPGWRRFEPFRTMAEAKSAVKRSLTSTP